MPSAALGEWPDKPPNAHRLMRIIRFLAEHTDRIIWCTHPEERIEQRNSRSDLELTDQDALRVLRLGDIKGPIVRGEQQGEWKVKVCAPINHERGAREVGVVTAVLNADQLTIVTVEWEDKR